MILCNHKLVSYKIKQMSTNNEHEKGDDNVVEEEVQSLTSQEVLELFVKKCQQHHCDSFNEKSWSQFLKQNIKCIPYSQFTRLTNTKRISEYVNLHLNRQENE